MGRRILTAGPKQALEISRDIAHASEESEIDESESEIDESETSVDIGDPVRHDEYGENLELLGEVYHAVKGGASSLNSSSLRQFKSPLENTVLHMAARYGKNEVVDQVAQQAPNLLFSFNSNRDSALHVAARAGHISTVKRLLAAYANFQRPEIAKEWITYRRLELDIKPEEYDERTNMTGLLVLMEEKNNQGNTVLHEAMMSSTRSMGAMIFQVLDAYTIIDYQGKSLSRSCYEFALNIPNMENQSVLCLAVEARYKETVDRILDKCPENAKPKGKSPLVAAIMKQDDDMLGTILRQKPEWIHLRDKHGRFPLHYAASIGYREGVVELLKKCKSCSIKRDKQGFFPLHLACHGGHKEVVEKLLEYCPDPTEMLDQSGHNIVHIAAKSGNLDVVRYLLESPQVDERMINQKDKNGNTPLHLATIRCHPKIVYALTWDDRVDLDLVNEDMKTALDITNAIYQSEKENPSLRQQLTWTALKSAGAKGSPSKILPVTPSEKRVCVSNIEPFKDRVETLTVVSTLIVTASVAACFSVPGEADGLAHNLYRAMFQIFIFCITISLFSSIIATIILFWARLGEIHLLVYALELAMPLLGVALVSLSLAFLAGVYTVISKLTWLASTFVVMTLIFVLIVLFFYIHLFLPSTSTNKALRYISYCPFIFLASLTETRHSHNSSRTISLVRKSP